MARTSARAKPREEARAQPRANAFVGRNGEVLTRSRDISGSYQSQFDVPERLREPGWALQWVRTSTLNAMDASNVTRMHEAGWRPVPANRPGYDEYFRTQGANDILRDGLTLMERPEGMNQQALEDDYKAALKDRVTGVEEFTAGFDLPTGFRAEHKKLKNMVQRDIEGVPSDLYPHRELALGDGDED